MTPFEAATILEASYRVWLTCFPFHAPWKDTPDRRAMWCDDDVARKTGDALIVVRRRQAERWLRLAGRAKRAGPRA